MSEKRFMIKMSMARFELAYERIPKINKNGEMIDVLTADEVVDFFNFLYAKNEQLRKENERQENEIKLLRKAYSKIPKGIRAVWKE